MSVERRYLNGNAKLVGTIPPFSASANISAASSVTTSAASGVTIYIEGTGICGPSLPPNVDTVPDLPSCFKGDPDEDDKDDKDDEKSTSSKDDDTSQLDPSLADINLLEVIIIALAAALPTVAMMCFSFCFRQNGGCDAAKTCC